MKRLLIAAIILLAAARGSWAFYEKGSHVLNLEGGGAIYSFKADVPVVAFGNSPQTDQVVDFTGTFGGGYLYYLNPHLGLGIQGQYSSFTNNLPLETVEGNIILVGVTPEVSAKSLIVMSLAKYSFRVDKTVMPYLLAGVGVHHSSRRMTATPVNTIVWTDTGTQEERVLGDGSATGLALCIGGGLDFPFGDHFVGGLEYRFDYLAKADYAMTPQGESMGASMDSKAVLANFLFKLGYKF